MAVDLRGVGEAGLALKGVVCGAAFGQKRLLMTGSFVAVQSVQLNKPASRGRLVFWFYCSSTWSGLMPALLRPCLERYSTACRRDTSPTFGQRSAKDDISYVDLMLAS